MEEKPKTVDVVEELFDRVEQRGVATVTVSDGTIFVFTAEVLRGLLADAESHPKKSAIVFVRRPAKVSG